MHKTTVATTVGVAAAALLALTTPASAKPHANPQGRTTFAVPARVLPGGIAPGTPRPDWDVCDQPGSLYLDAAFPTPGPNVYPQWNTFHYTSVRAATAAGYFYNPTAPANPSQPWPAYVSCTVSGPITVPTGHIPVRLSVTITDISSQAVRVAYVTDPAKESGPSVNYSTWAHARWVPLRPGESAVFVTPTFTLSNPHWNWLTDGFWLVRPTVPPIGVYWVTAQHRWDNFTEWINAFPNRPYLDPSRQTGQCSATLVPGTVAGVASSPNGGYWVLSNTGQVSACDAPTYGNTETATALGNVEDATTAMGIESVAAPPNADGLWLEASGAVVPFGHAQFLGQDNAWEGISVRTFNGTTTINGPISPTFTGFASTSSGNGYWLLTAYGRVLAYHAPYYGSANFSGATVCRRFNAPCTPSLQGSPVLTPAAAAGLAPTDGGKGYVIVARDGVTKLFGRGPTCSLPAGVSVAGVAADYRTGGYWVATTTGQVYACQAPSYPYKVVAGKVAGIAGLDNGLGYRLVTTNGRVYDYGAAVWHGDPN